MTSYLYRADGVKVKKLFGDLETHYLDGFQYKSTKPSESSVGGIGSIDDPNDVAQIKLRIIPTSEGYYDALLNQYVYNFTDHLGNVRLSYTDTNKDGVIQPRQYFSQTCDGPFIPPFQIPNCISTSMPGEIVEINTYYPFGLLHNYTATTQNAYQYKYNGKELQESGMYDYGARFYMPDLGRWGVVDPLAEKDKRWTPYRYAYNNPLRFIDPDGRNEELIINGDRAEEATAELQKSTNLKLIRNSETGKIEAEGKAITKADKELLSTIKDQKKVVKLEATSSYTIGDDGLIIVGAYLGSKSEGDKIFGEQVINIDQAYKIEKNGGKKTSANVLHEILESYKAMSIGNGIHDYRSADVQKNVYMKAHKEVNKIPEAKSDENIFKDEGIYKPGYNTYYHLNPTTGNKKILFMYENEP